METVKKVWDLLLVEGVASAPTGAEQVNIMARMRVWLVLKCETHVYLGGAGLY